MTIPTPSRPDAATGLALALVAASPAPVLLLDADFNILAASASFHDGFGVGAASEWGQPVAGLGSGEWSSPQLMSLLKTVRDGQAEIGPYHMELKRDGRPDLDLVVNVRKLAYTGQVDVRLLMTVADVTDSLLAAKMQKALMAEKDTLLHELQHRVANSLQIIASVLLQSARSVRSDETRQHLFDAHSRVMSIAALQQQLAVTGGDAVRLRPYFTELCASIGASMIHDQGRISLTVNADDSLTAANTSVSLGLLVTELVINALKHAFPGSRAGRITVDYHGHGSDWTLSVADDGVGISKLVGAAKAGLGTSIVEAISRQLDAKIGIADGHPGTIVSIVHKQGAGLWAAAPAV